MSEYDNTNRGSLWKNDKMRPDKQDPEFTGTVNVGGAEYWVSAWKRKPDAKPTAPALTFTVKRKEKGAKSPDPISTGKPGMSGYASKQDMNDDIPF